MEWAERAAQFKTEVVVKAETLPFGADHQGATFSRRSLKGRTGFHHRGPDRGAVCHVDRHHSGRHAGGYFGGRVGDFLEWVYNVFTAIPYILLVFAWRAVFKSGPLASTLGSGGGRW